MQNILTFKLDFFSKKYLKPIKFHKIFYKIQSTYNIIYNYIIHHLQLITPTNTSLFISRAAPLSLPQIFPYHFFIIIIIIIFYIIIIIFFIINTNILPLISPLQSSSSHHYRYWKILHELRVRYFVPVKHFMQNKPH
jgi:hypothetical protein